MTGLLSGLTLVAVLATTAERQQPLTIGVEGCLTKVFRDEPFSGTVSSTLRLQLARNEYEAGQLVLIAGDRRVENVRLECSDLVHRDGMHKIERSQVRCNFVGYTAPTTIRSEEVLRNRKLKPGKPRSYPDPLLLDEAVTIAANKVQPVWLTVFAPPDTLPGKYSGSVKIISREKLVAQAKLDVLVWDFVLPKSIPLYVWYYNDFNSFAGNWLGVTSSDWKAYKTAFRHYVRQIAQHRGSITPPLSYKAGPRFQQIIKIMIEEGCEYWWVNWFWGDYFNQALPEQERIAKEVYDYMKRNDWLDATFFMTRDEPDLRPEMQENRAKWKQHIAVLRQTGFPKIEIDMTWRCRSATSLMEPYPTVWCPQFSYFEPMYEDFLHEQRKGGDILGFYLTGSGTGREPRHYLPFPLTDMHRLFYYMWQHGLTLCEFWALDVRWRKTGPDPFGMVAGGGYGGGTDALIYPNKQKDLTRPFLSSLRFEAIRDGIEDYCYLWVLARLVETAEKEGKADLAETGKKVLKDIPARFGAHLSDYHLANPDDYVTARHRLAETIMKLELEQR